MPSSDHPSRYVAWKPALSYDSVQQPLSSNPPMSPISSAAVPSSGIVSPGSTWIASGRSPGMAQQQHQQHQQEHIRQSPPQLQPPALSTYWPNDELRERYGGADNERGNSAQASGMDEEIAEWVASAPSPRWNSNSWKGGEKSSASGGLFESGSSNLRKVAIILAVLLGLVILLSVVIGSAVGISAVKSAQL